ncbi:transposase [Streptomyces sp. ISL-94]|uniref:transposase n=1 Tax=Streptomyces sp. ISL-94 TaxID=2819190 RepID=UPI001BEA72AE|nr:transposase [Streptomyces sp. ISL-94]MBT2482200.1 transposase [Streptomyces sp. ISL-94]
MNEDPSPVQELLFPSNTKVVITSAELEGEAIRIEARCTASNACCPACGDWSAQIHGSYLRFPADLACAGRPCVLALRVRRFICASAECPRRTFVEQVPGLTRRHGRATERLRSTMSKVGLALAGRAGARLAAHLGIVTSRNTLLRRVMDLPDPPATQPRAVGAYADAAHTAAPQALQVADRFHLWQNLATAVEKTVAAHRPCLRDLPAPAPEPEPEWETTDAPAREDDDPSGKFAERARAHHALVHDLLAQGLGLREIARHLSWGRHTVQRYARAARWQDMVKGRKHQQPSKLDPFKPYLAQRWDETEGKVTILDLHREITARGFRGHYSTVQLWVRKALPASNGTPPAPAAPSIRQVTGWLTRHPATLTEEEKIRRKTVLDQCPELETTAHLVGSFAEMLTTLDGGRLTDWITDAMTAGLPGVSTFAVGLEADFDAVTAGLTTHWNSGPVEGAVNRIKMLKRQMFGRAGFPLLRKRVLLA